MVNIKQLRSDIAGPILYQGATNVKRSLNLFYNDVLGYLSINLTKIGTTGSQSYIQGDAGTLKLNNLTNHFIDIQNNIIKYSAADHRILGKLYIGADISPTANLHLAAGSTSSSAIRLTSGALTTAGNILAGNLEFLTDRLYFTQTTSLTRQTIAYLTDITAATLVIPNTQVVFGTGTGVASNDGFTHTGNGLGTPGTDNYIEIGYLKLGYVSTVGIGIDGSAFGSFTLRNNLSILTIDRTSDISGNFQFSLAGTEVMRIKSGRLVLKNGLSLDFGENLNGPSRIEGENDLYISSSNNGTSNIIFRPAYAETFRLSTTLASLQTNLRLTNISSNGVIKTYFQAFSGEKGLVSYNNGASNYTGSSIPLNLSLQLYNATNDNSAMDIVVSTNSNGAIYNLPTIIGTEYGTRTDKTGFRIDLLNTLHTTNTKVFQVLSSYFENLSGGRTDQLVFPSFGGIKSTGNLYLDSAANIFLVASSGVNVNTLAGTGTRMVVADNTGTLSTQAIPSSAALNQYQVGIGNGSNLLSGTNQVIYDGIFKINPQAITFTSNFLLGKLAIGTSTGNNIIGIQNTDISGIAGVIFGQDNSNLGVIAKYGSTAAGIFVATSIPLVDTIYIQAGLGFNLPLHLGASVIYNQTGNTGTNYGTRLDATGLRIGQISTLHTSNNYLFEVGGLRFPGSGLIYSAPNEEAFISMNGSNCLVGSYQTYFQATQNNAKIFISGAEKLDINGFTADFKNDIKVTVTRTTIGAAFAATSNSYNLAGQSTIHVNDGSGLSLGIGYGGGTTDYFMYGVSAGLYIRGALAGTNKYGVFIEQSGIVANGKSRIGDSNFNTGHTLEVVGDLQVTDQSGTGNRIVESNSSGVQSASKLLINDWISDTTTRANLEDTGNWTSKVYTGPAITNTFQSQKHYDADYLFICVENDEWIRIALV